jgi:4-amino-4-deoxy-L-arabinose transferase-like glycosyltransferase
MRLEFVHGATFFDAHPDLALRALRISRLANLIWPLLGTVLMYAAASRCLGTRAGFISAVLWAFCPLVIGHGVLLPPDIAAAVMVIAVGIIGASLHPPFNVWRATGIGFVLGAAILTKTTLIVLYPLLCVWIFGTWCRAGRFSLRSGWIQEAMVLSVAAWLILNVGYGWEGFGTRFGDYQFVSSPLNGVSPDLFQPGNRFQSSALASVPVILPKNFVLGIDTQYKDFEINFFHPYLLGRWQRDGFLTFYLWYFLLKLPVGFLALIGIGFVSTSFRMVLIPNLRLFLLLMLTGTVLFVFLSSQTSLNYCQRYALVCLPALCLLGGAGSLAFKSKTSELLLWSIVGTTVAVGMWNSTHSLAYYNSLAGGPAGGRFCLHGNATDWGQDAQRIGNWTATHPDRRPLAVATVGCQSSLKAYGLEADSIRFEAHSKVAWDRAVNGKKVSTVGWHIVSFVHLLDPRSPYHELLHQEPVESIGWTHQVYFIDALKAKDLSGRSKVKLPGDHP